MKPQELNRSWTPQSIIRRISAPTEFGLVIFICFGLTIWASLRWLIRNVSAGIPTSAPTASSSSAIQLNNNDILSLAVLKMVTLGIVFWIGRIRGWSLASFGFKLRWKSTGGGVLLFIAFLGIQRLLGFLTRNAFHSTVDFHRVSNLTIPFIILISIVNPVFEESIEVGYFFHALQQSGMWLTVLTSASFRALLHMTMGISGVIFMFAEGLLHGFVYWRWRQLWPLILAHGLQMLYSLLSQMK